MRRYRRPLIFIIPVLAVTINCNTVMSRLQPAAGRDRACCGAAAPHPELAATDEAGNAWTDSYSYTPAQTYTHARWAVDMGWYTEEELYSPRRRLDWEIGRVVAFNYYDDQGDEIELRAVLRYITPHFYLMFEAGALASEAAIVEAGERLETEIYPVTRRVFGEEWSPGIDGDPHILVVHKAELGDSYGKFASDDECPILLCDYSNGHEMVYIGLDDLRVGNGEYLAVAAHELQHLIGYNTDGGEATWVGEGLSVLAEIVNGYPKLAGDPIRDFFSAPDRQLNDWPSGAADDWPNYGASYLFALYLYERFGESFIHDWAIQPHDDMAGVEATLPAYTDLSLNQIFGHWAVANLVDDTRAAEGQFGYVHEDLPPVEMSAAHDAYPVSESAAVHQYAADYVSLKANSDLLITFDGDSDVPLLPTRAHSGDGFWWSNRLDSSIASLQTGLDLSELSNPKIRFWMWFDTEADYDVVTVQVSDDGGRSWTILEGSQSQRQDWWEHRYTGTSGPGRTAEWVEEEIDLRRWEGDSVLFRIQYITDSSATGPGFAFDDFVLESDEGVRRREDFESGAEAWQAMGFVRAGNEVRQSWSVYVVSLGREPGVVPLQLDGEARGQIDLQRAGDGAPVILVVAATAPFTTEEAHYTYEVTARP